MNYDELRNRFVDTLARIPERSGVYIMKDLDEKILYIGKAINLKSRVGSYFRDNHDDRPQIPVMLGKLSRIDWVITENETEALVLEANLVKEHMPPYNIDLRDDKRYPYVKITTSELFPRILIARRVEKDGNRYFGPFTDATSIRRVVTVLRKLFQIRSCSMVITDKTTRRECIDYSMKLCSGSCNQRITPKSYREGVDHVMSFFQGNRRQIVTLMTDQMMAASEEMRFEEAAIIRDRIVEMKKLIVRQGVDLRKPDLNADLFGFYRGSRWLCLSIMMIRRGVIINQQSRVFRTDSIEDENFAKVIVDYYTKSADDYPDEIILSEQFADDVELLTNWFKLQGKKMAVAVPVRGEKRQLVERAEKNGRVFLMQNYITDGPQLLAELAQSCSLPKVPKTIEAFDISNLGDRFTVAGMVHFRDGEPDKSNYRRFKIKAVSGQNDFAMMMEAVSRRLNRLIEEEKPFPDLLLIDGGKGQLGAAREALTQFENPPMLISLAKKEELLFSDYREDPVQLGEGHPVRRLMERIRDEVHRFAITYHRKLRGRQYNHSLLEEIAGIGPKKAELLIKRFGSAKGVALASDDDLKSVNGVTESVIWAIREDLGGLFEE